MSELPECTCDDSSDGHSLLCPAESAFEDLERQLAHYQDSLPLELTQDMADYFTQDGAVGSAWSFTDEHPVVVWATAYNAAQETE